uniref:Uncharacterized protein n=1 Tax=Rhizophora mucronata TaxID=61149 RepID=A0A2P2MIL3_RHIMU
MIIKHLSAVNPTPLGHQFSQIYYKTHSQFLYLFFFFFLSAVNFGVFFLALCFNLSNGKNRWGSPGRWGQKPRGDHLLV